MLIDLHTHTKRWSWDSDLDPNDLIERSRQAGLDGICLSEHDYFWDPREVYELGRRHNFLVLPAIELNTEDGHMLCYGLDTYVYGMHRSQELAAHIDRVRGAMIAAHPYRRQLPWRNDADEYVAALERAARNPAYRHCHALERLNGRGSQRENEFSAHLCDFMGMPGTAGTDAHSISEIGRCATEFSRRIETLDDLIEELRAGRFRAVSLRPEPQPVRLS